jgi:hypothetical protein
MKLSGDLTCSGYDVQWLVAKARLGRSFKRALALWRLRDRLAIQAG